MADILAVRARTGRTAGQSGLAGRLAEALILWGLTAERVTDDGMRELCRGIAEQPHAKFGA